MQGLFGRDIAWQVGDDNPRYRPAVGRDCTRSKDSLLARWLSGGLWVPVSSAGESLGLSHIVLLA